MLLDDTAEGGKREGETFDIIIVPPKRVISVKLEAELVNLLDRIWREYGYSSRSEFIREAIMYYIQFLTNSRRRVKDMTSMFKAAELEDILEEIEKITL
ncbi:MAG: ribbon-helix-helix domain-containing protein [Pyrodictiaceae archaeon]